MRALVFGGTGMLGRAVVAEGRRRGHPTLGLGRRQADVTEPVGLADWVDEFRPQVVFNCAAYTRVDDAESDEETAFEVNARGVAHAAAAAGRAEARFVHVSTDYVFDGAAERPYAESASTAPASAYGRSKLAGEAEALAHPRSTAVRTSWLFGPGGGNFAATMVRLIEAGTDPLRVVADQVGCPTYTPFLARALWDLAAAEVDGVVHYRNRDPVSWHGFATEIARSWAPGVAVEPVTTAEFPRPAPRPAYSVLAVERFEQALGRPVEPWSWGLADYLSQIRGGIS